jgi:CheY-like chemotaxis protein/anti-sigma regulatory factor (Ser/Thr protein kinase)
MHTVLVVDDSAVDRRLAGGLLEREFGCAVCYAEDGRAALRVMAERVPDLVLTDLQMPDLNGLELVAAVKADYPHVPVILMTARGSEEIAANALRAGAVSYVPKRRLADDLMATVSRVLGDAVDERVYSRLMHTLESSEAVFALRNDPVLIRGLVRHLQEVLRCLPLGDETERLRVGVAVEEALENACYHGNLEVGSVSGPAARNGLEERIRTRIMEMPYAARRIQVRAKVDRNEAVFVIRDEGPGFDVARYMSAGITDGDAGAGRGIVLMRSVLDEVRYNASGNEVTLVKRRQAEPQT